jgi:hypothetical protein
MEGATENDKLGKSGRDFFHGTMPTCLKGLGKPQKPQYGQPILSHDLNPKTPNTCMGTNYSATIFNTQNENLS